MKHQPPATPFGRFNAILSSQPFFWGIVMLLIAQASWIALTGRYPMAFDENFHLGIIRLYASHISPFWASQPANADAYGAVARDPSYLYQWLMSFPYRCICLFTQDQTLQVIWLRFINIALFSSSLFVFRRLLLKVHASRAVVHACLLTFVLIPVVPLLAAQINYDNLFIPLTGFIMLLSVTFMTQLRKTKTVNVALLSVIASLSLLASLVKYAFLPILLALTVYLSVQLLRAYSTKKQLLQSLKTGFKRLRRVQQVSVVVLFIVAALLFGERYGINIVRYHNPVPDCGKVLTVEQCSAYGPWNRDYNLEQAKVSTAYNPIVFMNDWLYGMWLRMFFAVDGPGTNFETRGPFVIPAISAIVFAVTSFVLVIRYMPRLYKRYDRDALNLILLVTITYVVTLWLDNFRDFISTGQAVAINGRYLFPVLLPALLLSALSFKELLVKRPKMQLAIGCTAIISLLLGGGALTYILRSNSAWYWPASPVKTANQTVQRDIGPHVPGYNRPNEFLH